MRTIEISTHLAAPPETVQQHISTPKLLEYICHGLIRFAPIDPPAFPERWEDGEFKAVMYLLSFLPIGWQIIAIELQPMRGDTWSLRDNGRGWAIKTWDHMIEVTPDGEGSHYVDRITVDAGILTPLVSVFASVFYRHRQRRWRRLVANQFDYSR